LPPDVEKRNDGVEVQITTKFKDDHFHFIMNDDNEKAREFVEAEAAEIGLDLYNNISQKEPPDQIVFHNRQAIGDVLTFTAGVRDFKKAFPNTRVGVISTAMHIWDHNPHIDHSFRDDRHILKVGPGFLTNKSNSSDLHMCNAFRIDIENKTGLKIPQGPIRPDIWMTEEEYKSKPLIDGPYWLFIYGGEPGWPCKQYHRWQEVIDILKDDIQIIQLGVNSHPYPRLNNVIDYIGKTEDKNHGIRHLWNLFLHAQGTLGLVSMHMHLSAAFGNPCVVLAGAREPARFTQYFGHQYIQTNGTMFCGEHTSCWKCKLKGCKNLVKPDNVMEGHHVNQVPKCVEMIEPEEIAEAVRKYYKGGRLEYGKKIPNKFFKNIAKEAKVFTVPTPDKIDNKHLEKWGFKWGGSSITDRDWVFIKDIFKEYKIKTVLEFGGGLATLLMGTMAETVITLENKQEVIKNISKLVDPKKHIIKHWDGKTVPLEALSDYKYPEKYDFAFVDGPSGGSREWSTKYASEHSDLIIIHDAGRKPEKEWQDKYLAKDFQLIAKGGHRCSLWLRRSCINPIEVDGSKPLARMITTTRGWGGSERSTCYIMQGLLDKGYRVELNPTGNISGEYLKNIPKGVIQREWESMREPADIAIFYTSDCIWNFNKPQYKAHMPHLNAKRKIMVLNYKIGGAGNVDWTFGWDKYLFLNSEHEAEILKRIKGANTKVMAPPTDLTEFFKVQPNYDIPLKLIRHNSQGDNKHPDYTNNMIRDILRIDSSIEMHFMPARSDCMDHPQVYKYRKNQPPVYDFLKNGNCFIYHLPPGYTEGGPRVIIEAMAAGLPVICDNHSGPKDRVTDETGWRCNTYEEILEVIKILSSKEGPTILRTMGELARERARKEFVPENWVKTILEDK
jgi:ADP-heptose:LPS heptosyltransferase